MAVIEELAVEIDRTVLAVGTRAGQRHRERFLDRTAGMSAPSRALLPRIADFLLAGPVTRRFVAERIPYTDTATVLGAIDELVEKGFLLAGTADDLSAAARVEPALRSVVDGRSEMANELWRDVPDTLRRVGELAVAVRAAAPDAAFLASWHASLPEASDDASRLYQRLTTIRYIRADAHRGAWQGMDLDGPTMVQLTIAWHGEIPGDPTLLTDRGWWDGTLTDAGRSAREQVESETNRRNVAFLGGVDDHLLAELVATLHELPGTQVPRII